MKYFLTLLVAFSLFACKDNKQQEPFGKKTESTTTEEETTSNYTSSEKIGEEIFNGKGNCFSCHKPDQKVIGPSIAEIAKIYADENGDMTAFLKGKADPIVDPSQYAVMKTNFYITKHFTDEEMQGVVDYVMSFKPE
ncbi:cytochrome C552 [Flavobacterium arcticum]|uniref:Cytochrome C552 n=1 Tax=Flavobacterium arcticum TaxID=1784713 RepID=A0A345HAZ3_9FLAO|nr:c-type cytochrome [Flavobacterium arcticum]AXG73753.1 cytochrome C552 [Flavobacterium arcticum]KAF2511705.1 c-type cytochrome [Flavobacterium arcticum]